MLHLIPIVIILVVANSRVLNRFYSRKLVHMGCGIVLAKINRPTETLSYVIYFIAISSIVITMIRPFYFAKLRDFGVISYNSTIIVFLLLKIPLRLLLPMFIIDPVASIVGTNLKGPVWIHTKTVSGSLACLVSSYVTLYYVPNLYHRVVLSVVLTLTEGVLKDYDNLGIILVLFFYYCLTPHMGYDLRL